MPAYRIFRLLNGEVCRPADMLDGKDDAEATEKAQEQARLDGLDIEVWQGRRWVGLVKARGQ